jgi:HEAT repeat protein
MVCREAARQPGLALTPELLSPQVVELLLSGLSVDTSSEIRARAAEVIIFLADPRATPVLRNLLLDHQWFVRLRTVRALAHLGQAAAPLHLDIRECLRDPHWRVREAAIQTLISLGPEGKRQLYEHFLTSPDRTTREQIVEVIERTGLMAALVEEYSAGTKGVDALMVEQLAGDAAPLGLSGVLRTLDPEIRQKFLHRFIPDAPSKMPLAEEMPPEVESANSLPQDRAVPPCQAA